MLFFNHFHEIIILLLQMQAWRTGILGNIRTKEMNLLNKIEAKILTTYQENWLVSDAVLAACLINQNVSHNIKLVLVN